MMHAVSRRQLLLACAVGAVAAASAAAPATATMPGGNGLIAFAQSRFQDEPDGPGSFVRPDIYTVTPGGGGARRLTHDGDSSTPAVSPDGRRLAFTRGNALWVMAADGAGAHRVRGVPANCDCAPTWSPDARRIAYTSPYGLWVVPAAGGTPRRLVGPVATDAAQVPNSADWSPAGRRIAFARGDTGVWVVPVRGGPAPPRERPTGVDSANQPSWSPDGRRLAFVRVVIHRDGSPGWLGIETMRADGRGHHRLARGLTLPEWAPDGRALVAAGANTGPLQLVAVPGGALRALADSGTTSSSSASPSWQPLRPRR
jgi:Tol biopolymer transport system component